MFVDMPPGTGDVPLTIFQSVPVDGIVIVTTPQELVSLIVTKAVKMAKMMNIPVIALVENMSYIECPDCGKKIFPFGQSRAEEEAAKFGIPLAARIPIDPRAAKAFDNGLADNFYDGALKGCGDIIEKSFPAKNQ
ncbi:Iron-sulfur cluster carrier protein [bioreactor metagenome]|uniref:Iron-sulfur cluster carrier protein n=1 Tax=bioreactor metagenome TaxID=1076179 RepID=A0A645GQR8_9ZZZZ